MLYRIYTESNLEFDKTAISFVSDYFEGFTVIHAKGYWQGQAEDSLIIEIVATPQDRIRIVQIAQNIKSANGQQAVMLTIQPIEVEFL